MGEALTSLFSGIGGSLGSMFGGSSGGTSEPSSRPDPYEDLTPAQRRLLGIAALQDAFASLAGRQGGAMQSAMPVANLYQQQEARRRYMETLRGLTGAGAEQPAQPGAQQAQAPEPQPEPGGPFNRATINRALDTLARAEARGPGVINQQGYAGQYQLGAPLAVDAGVYRPAQGEISPRGEWNGQWGGTFNIPGFENVRTIQDFLRNPDAQRRAAELAMNVNVGRIQSMGLNEYVGRNVGGVNVTPEAILQGSWLGGAGGVRNFLQSGQDARDALGTPVSRWMSLPPVQQAQAQGQPQGAPLTPQQQAIAGQAVNRLQLSPQELAILGAMPPEMGFRALMERVSPTRVGLQPIMVEETGPNGQRVVVPYFPTTGGQLRRAELPPGARVSEGIRTVDTGTGTEIIGGRTGQPTGNIPRQTTEREAQEQEGRARGIARAAAPAVIDTTTRTINQINEVINHPSFSTASGVLSPLQRIPGTSAYDFGQRIEQIKGQAFLEAYNSLRGAGAITEQEGIRASNAIARINAGLAPADLRKALEELADIARRGQERARQNAPAEATQPAQQTQQGAQGQRVLRYDPNTGRIE